MGEEELMKDIDALVKGQAWVKGNDNSEVKACEPENENNDDAGNIEENIPDQKEAPAPEINEEIIVGSLIQEVTNGQQESDIEFDAVPGVQPPRGKPPLEASPLRRRVRPNPKVPRLQTLCSPVPMPMYNEAASKCSRTHPELERKVGVMKPCFRPLNGKTPLDWKAAQDQFTPK